MYTNFLKISVEKQNRIINACIKEFSLNGYDNASTNEIVKEAGISKGLLFHYFKNKKMLFFYIYDYAINFYVKYFYDNFDFSETDLFNRFQIALKMKSEIIGDYPLFFKFLEKVYFEDAAEVKNELIEKNKDMIQFSWRIFENIDTSKFRENLNLQQAVNVISWTIEGIENKFTKEVKLTKKAIDYQKSFDEVKEYIELLKKIFYK